MGLQSAQEIGSFTATSNRKTFFVQHQNAKIADIGLEYQFLHAA
jgi:hypothetical protein